MWNGADVPLEPQYTYMGGVRGADGALGYAWQDDCYTADRPGDPGADLNSVDIPYPAPANRGNPEETFTVSAKWRCDPGNPGDPPCPPQQQYDFVFIQRGAFVSPSSCTSSSDWCYETWGAEHSPEFSLAPNVWKPIVEFDALGYCKSLLDGVDCGL